MLGKEVVGRGARVDLIKRVHALLYPTQTTIVMGRGRFVMEQGGVGVVVVAGGGGRRRSLQQYIS